MPRLRLTMRSAGILTGLYVILWQGVAFAIGESLVDTIGWSLFYLIGLGWTIFLVERAARRIELRYRNTDPALRPAISVGGESVSNRRGGWNPLDPAAVYYNLGPGFFLVVICVVIKLMTQFKRYLPERYGDAISEIGVISLVCGVFALGLTVAQSRKLRQSLAMLAAYSFLFMLVFFLVHLRFGSGEESEYDLPAGGGNDSPQAMSVKVTKVVRKKYVINPYSSILFAAPPPIDNVDVKLTEETANRYQVGQGDGGLGQGEGEGGGFGSGKAGGKIRFIRLRHADKTWDKNFGIGGDRNLLTELEVRFPKMKGRIAEETESVDCVGLGLFKEKAAPPLIYIGGVHNFAPSAADKRILKQYLIDRHGMILGDSLGGGFHGGFVAAMNEITGVTSVPIPRDDAIHKRPFEIPQLPIVVAHGGTTPYGWKIDGRWAVYYHPGALSDAWRDDRAGIKKDIADQCYQLGLNIVSYAHREHDTWRRSQQP